MSVPEVPYARSSIQPSYSPFPLLFIPYLDAVSPSHPASPWLARLARCIGDLLVCIMLWLEAATGSSVVLLDTNRQYVDMTRSFATPLPLLLTHRPTSGFVCFAPVVVAVVWGEKEERLMC